MPIHTDKHPTACVNDLQHAVDKASKSKQANEHTRVEVRLGDLDYALHKLAERGDKLKSVGRTNHFPMVNQTLFGTTGGQPDAGNCYPACVATITGIALDKIPHIYAINPPTCEGNLAGAATMASFLGSRGYMLAYYPAEVVIDGMRDGWFFAGAKRQMIPVIVSGKSPRGDFQHAVVGVLDRQAPTGWTMLHDPHPSGEGIETTESFELISRFQYIEG